MAKDLFGMFRTVARWYSDIAAYREELRTERHISELPEHLLKDIGWPDAYAERLARREDDAAETQKADSAGHRPWSLDWPHQYERLRRRKSNTVEIGC
jgi:uncharacterized protein YjiS (DUF1127 family)